MSRARLWLHLAALLAPLAAVSVGPFMARDAGVMFGLSGFAIYGSIAVVSAQVAALLRWRALERHAREGHGAWRTGIGMAAITHLLFGVLADAVLIAAIGGWQEAAGTGKPSDIVLQMAFFFAASVFALGAVTFPATALLAHWIAALRRKELVDDVG